MTAQQNGTFYAFVNGGIEALVASRSGTDSSYINAGLEALVPSKSGTSHSFLNAGIEALTLSKSGTSGAYVNAGVEHAQDTTIVRGPRGWGVIPTGSQTIIFKTEQAKATTYAFENTTT